jgi:hypothetical protein
MVVVGISVLAALASASSLSVSSAVAKAHHSRVRVQSREWLVSIGGRETKVPANGTVVYCASDVVRSMTPRVVLSALGPGRHYYAYHIVDPKGRRSYNLFVGFDGSRTLVDQPFIPVQWNKAAAGASETNPLFHPGTYTLEMALDAEIRAGHIKGAKLQAIETLTLKPEKGKSC